MENKLKIGWAEVDITPHQKIRVAGQFYERVSDVVETPISVTALALESAADGTQGVICSCDLDCISEGLVELVRAELRDVEGLDKKARSSSVPRTRIPPINTTRQVVFLVYRVLTLAWIF